MPDVFISYSRKDKDFVGRLYQALAEHKPDTWVDWEGIPPTAEWLKEIFRAIEAADTFVFVISPDGVVSEVCRMEIGYALKHNKRLVPVVRQEVAAGDVPPDLAKLNWIFFRDHDDFDTSFQNLIAALNTDLDHVRAHTRLLVKALEWYRQGRDRSFLLRGRDLKAAEEWLAGSGQKEPKPTELQGQYILASRQAATLRQRLMLGAVTVGLTVSMILGLIAFFKHQDAESRGRIALSRQLAAQSISLSDNYYDLALLLTLEANRVADTVESRGSLLTVLQRHPKVERFLYGHKRYILSLAFSKDNKFLASGIWCVSKPDQALLIWNLFENQPIGTPIDDEPNSLYKIEKLAFSPCGRMLISCGSGKIIFWDLNTFKAIGKSLPASLTFSLAFNPEGNLLATGHRGGIDLWDITERRHLADIPSGEKGGTVSGLAFSQDGKYLLAGDERKLAVWDVNKKASRGAPLEITNKYVKFLTINKQADTLAAMKDESTILLGRLDSKPSLQVSVLGQHPNAKSLEFSPDGKTLASTGIDQAIRLWNVADQKPQGEPLRCGPVPFSKLVFSPDGRKLGTGRGNGQIIVWDLTRQLGLGEILDSTPTEIVRLAVSPQGDILAWSGNDRAVRLVDLAHRSNLGPPLAGHQKMVTGLAFSPDGKIIASGDEDNNFILWDVTRRHPLASIKKPDHLDPFANLFNLVFSPNGKMLLTGGYRTGVLWNISKDNGSFQLEIAQKFDNFGAVAFNNNGNIAAWGRGEHIELYDMVNQKKYDSILSGHTGQVSCLAFSTNGKYLASGSTDCTVMLWNLETFSALSSGLVGHVDAVQTVAFSFDGKMLASGSSDKTIILWDVSCLRQIGTPLVGHSGPVMGLVFLPERNHLISAGWDKKIIQWDVDLKSWKERARRIANRNLTRAEWQQYLDDEPYRQTCPGLPIPSDEK